MLSNYRREVNMEPLFPWVGVRRVAIVPVLNRLVDVAPPADWEYQIRSRLFYDPDAVTGLDRSFQNYLQALSYGRAFIDGDIFPLVWSDNAEINIPAMNSLPFGHGYTHLIAVLPHSFGTDRGPWAFWDTAPVNGITAWARVALYDDRFLSSRQPIGVWGMEILHMLVHFGDLYRVNPNLGTYDVMAGAGASSHASAHTKEAMGWLPQGQIVQHTDGTTHASLQAIAMPQPPPPGRVTAIRIPSRLTTHYFMVEARLAIDQYERSDRPGDGIPKEGVIVYEVADRLSVFLRSIPALSVGGRYQNPEEGLSIVVDQAVAGGFSVTIKSSRSSQCPQLLDQIATLKEDLKGEKDPLLRREIQKQITESNALAKKLGCV